MTPQTEHGKRWPNGIPENAIETQRDQLVHAHFENACGDLGCMERRLRAAMLVLRGWKEHADICWAVEVFEVEIGLLRPDQVGNAPLTIPSRAAIEEQARAEVREGERIRTWDQGYDEGFRAGRAEVRASLATEPMEVAPSIDVERWASWIMERGLPGPDHACVECVPGGEIVVPGFRCVYHDAARLAVKGGSDAG